MATVPAVVGTARVGNFRVGYLSAALVVQRAVRLVVYVNSTDRSHRVDLYTVSILDDLNELPNTCSFEAFGFTPALAQVVKITYAGATNKEFEGTITGIAEYHDRLNNRIVYRLTCTDYTRDADAQMVTKAYGSQSATTTAQDIITNFTSGFTQVNISASLPTIASIQFKMTPVSSALRQLCDAFGGDTFIDYDKDVHVFLTDTAITPDAITTSNSAFKTLKYTSAIDRIANRIFVEGLGTMVAADVAVGETILPVATIAIFDPAGGLATIGNQILIYTGRTEVSPGTALTATPASGAGLTALSAYSYAFSFVTGAGETVPSPLTSTATLGVVSAPSAPPIVTDDPPPGASGSLTNGANYKYVITYSTATLSTDHSSETAPSSASTTVQPTNGALDFHFVDAMSDPSITWIHVYRTLANGSTYFLVFSYSRAQWTTEVAGYNRNGQLERDTISDATISAHVTAPVANTTTVREQMALSGILVGPSGTTDRKVYRTVGGGSQLKLAFSVGNDTATTATDSTTDGSLGANAPTTDTSGLTVTGFGTTSGTTSAGATSMTLASATAFKSTGGWARIQDMTIRYTGTTATTLTGIPASGAGAVTSSIPSASLVQGLVALTGVPASGTGSVVSAISNGDVINLLVQRDDTTSQATYGIRQAYIQDRRLSIAGAQARGDAELTLRKDPFITGSFITTDTKVRSGRKITITMPTWGLSGTFTITRVRIFWKKGDTHAQREVTFASNAGQNDLYRILRRLREQQQQNTAT